jgi:hypothetical protein
MQSVKYILIPPLLSPLLDLTSGRFTECFCRRMVLRVTTVCPARPSIHLLFTSLLFECRLPCIDLSLEFFRY